MANYIRNKKLQNKQLLTITILFFVLVNTAYFWEAKLGYFSFPFFLILFIIYIIIVIFTIYLICIFIIDKNTKQLITICISTFLLLLIFLKPTGIINFEALQGADLLIASREGGGNCATVLKLKQSKFFKERSVCFGITEVEGNYELIHDTIYFKNIRPISQKNDYYKFAIIEPSRHIIKDKIYVLTRYKSLNDTIGSELWITKNEFIKMKE